MTPRLRIANVVASVCRVLPTAAAALCCLDPLLSFPCARRKRVRRLLRRPLTTRVGVLSCALGRARPRTTRGHPPRLRKSCRIPVYRWNCVLLYVVDDAIWLLDASGSLVRSACVCAVDVAVPPRRERAYPTRERAMYMSLRESAIRGRLCRRREAFSETKCHACLYHTFSSLLVSSCTVVAPSTAWGCCVHACVVSSTWRSPRLRIANVVAPRRAASCQQQRPRCVAWTRC